MAIVKKAALTKQNYMVLNYIWIAFFLIAFAIALVKLVFFGDTTVFPK